MSCHDCVFNAGGLFRNSPNRMYVKLCVSHASVCVCVCISVCAAPACVHACMRACVCVGACTCDINLRFTETRHGSAVRRLRINQRLRVQIPLMAKIDFYTTVRSLSRLTRWNNCPRPYPGCQCLRNET